MRVTAPVVRPMSSASRPAVAEPLSSSISRASTSLSDKPSRIATVCPNSEPWMFTRRSALTISLSGGRLAILTMSPHRVTICAVQIMHR